MNYGEEMAYWYLRLNGFFLIQNFVIHRTNKVVYSSDIDLLAVRFPHVFEEIGGQEDDWDNILRSYFDVNKITGIICEVKTGSFKELSLFKKEKIEYAINRFGFAPDIASYAETLTNESKISIPNTNFEIGKLFVSNLPPKRKNFLYISIGEIRAFIEMRIEKYLNEKWRDRLFFHSNYLQEFIDRTKNEA